MAAASYDQRYQHSRTGFAMDYADEQHSGVAEETPPKIKAEENPWPGTGTLPQILMRQHARD
jgi:hypothetical protein